MGERNWIQLFGGYIDNMLWVLRWEKLLQVCCIVMKRKGNIYVGEIKVARPISLNITQEERSASQKKLDCAFIVTGKERM